ncbi:SIMPL domain-containing protein [Pseudonocardia sp. ICBG1293]|uniref:SIMPL domain-containing protein n=1 Tax=Pseudonocardia sp. ICBG1293 TaxID=2844382 RepID=UPI001CCD500F|nr:SIMPL domain-containing protein [Pseudonocardia sp. ICBG1293]
MSDVVIRVRGEHERQVPAERGTAQVVVEAQGPEAGPVRAEVEAGTAALVADVRALHDPDAGPGRRHVVDQARSWVEQPSFEGRPQPPVHHASVSVSVEFDDVARLGAWLTGVGRFAGAQVRGITWDLAREHRREVERSARQDALRQAVERAQDYADALDLGPVAPRSVADSGLLGHRAVPMSARAMAAPGGFSEADGGLGALLAPDDITVRAEVEAEFVVRRES